MHATQSIFFSLLGIGNSRNTHDSDPIRSVMSHNMRRRLPANAHTHTNNTVKDSAAPAKPPKGLISWDKLPDWAKDNQYTHTGYRKISFSYLESFRSCFSVHNETGNIYSHLLAMLWMILLPIVFYPYAKEHYSSADGDDWTVFGLYFLGGALCFGLSTSYHILSNHSHEVHDVWLRLDLFGISTVTAGCFPPGMWYTFPCADRSTKMFWISVRRAASRTAITCHADMSQQVDLIAQLTAAIIVLFVRRFRQPAWRPLRGFLFSFMASSAFYPIIYACFQNGYRQMNVEAGATRYALTVVTYLTAVTMYAVRRTFLVIDILGYYSHMPKTRIPEKWSPGSFDLWGQSHQIFHVLIAVGLTIHFSAFAKAFDYSYRIKQC